MPLCSNFSQDSTHKVTRVLLVKGLHLSFAGENYLKMRRVCSSWRKFSSFKTRNAVGVGIWPRSAIWVKQNQQTPTLRSMDTDCTAVFCKHLIPSVKPKEVFNNSNAVWPHGLSSAFFPQKGALCCNSDFKSE